jgi:hypothetical protein
MLRVNQIKQNSGNGLENDSSKKIKNRNEPTNSATLKVLKPKEKSTKKNDLKSTQMWKRGKYPTNGEARPELQQRKECQACLL